MTSTIAGSAHTPKEIPPHFKPLGQTGLWCHPLGFGCYRIEEDDPTHEAALRAYLAQGGNLIDTSANYTDGGSERTVGRVLRDIDRASVIIVTKGGYIQGDNMRLAQRRHFPEVVKYGPGLWHCIHPDFLATQIERSRERLGVATLDVFLLHNPEYFLNARAKHGVTDADHDEFYRRIREAFVFLEAQVAAGTLRFYGISSNNFPLPQRDPTHTSLARCLAQAESITPHHHFKVVQFPLNLFETGAVTEINNAGLTPLALCTAKGIGTLANRPLNAFTQQRMVRLADFLPPGSRPSLDALAAALSPLREHETRLTADFKLPLMGEGGLTDWLLQLAPRLDSPFAWEQNAYRLVVLPVRRWLEQLTPPAPPHAVAFTAWQEQFMALANAALASVAEFAAAQAQHQSDAVRKQLSSAGYESREQSLSQMAINTLRSLPELSCVLVGMRRPQYVADACQVLNCPPVDGVSILRYFANRAPSAD
ncbi:MAG: aldo/keto reductase [Chloracidobacterium sp.]|uniref:Aldo/keto reductase n=1 Tax=Chloracidobacterium validum TaxID=2821543 RepID=A0ABX8BAL0_9BACT|nr:aldo/keto reductase [Chloracidobacterium validum]QUW02585.1 aldo/keto reductase [Chloracidobacterium validum]